MLRKSQGEHISSPALYSPHTADTVSLTIKCTLKRGGCVEGVRLWVSSPFIERSYLQLCSCTTTFSSKCQFSYNSVILLVRLQFTRKTWGKQTSPAQISYERSSGDPRKWTSRRHSTEATSVSSPYRASLELIQHHIISLRVC